MSPNPPRKLVPSALVGAPPFKNSGSAPAEWTKHQRLWISAKRNLSGKIEPYTLLTDILK